MANTSGTGTSVTGASSASLATDETEELIASNKVEGTPVYSPQGEKLGSIHNFMVGKRSGKVAYAVMGIGGVLGLGERYHPLPWEALTYDAAQGGYVVDLDKERLSSAPSYQAGEDPFSDRNYGRRLVEYYGLPRGEA